MTPCARPFANWPHSLSEDECELVLVNWLDDSNLDPSLVFHSYAVAWRSALRSRSTSGQKST
jgi:hypothetical protein